MKKHVFGAALFSLIVASFAIVYAVFFTPVVSPTLTVRPDWPERNSRCDKMRRDFGVEIVSSNYYVAEKKIVTKIRLTQRYGTEVPDKVNVALMFSSGRKDRSTGLETIHEFDNPFADGLETVRTIETKVGAGQIDLNDENFYVNATVDRSFDGMRRSFRGEVTQAKAVLFVFGKIDREVPRLSSVSGPVK